MTVLSKKQQQLRNLVLMLPLLVILLLWSWRLEWSLTEYWPKYLLFILGYFLGLALMFADEHYFYAWYADTDGFLVTRSALFIVCLPLLSIFVFTSTGSALGMALILAINLFLCLEVWLLGANHLLLNQHLNLRLKKDLAINKLNLLRIGLLIYVLFLLINCL